VEMLKATGEAHYADLGACPRIELNGVGA